MVWSTASFVALIMHSTGWEDNSKLVNGPIEPASDVPVIRRMLPSGFVCLAFLRTVALITALNFYV